MAYWGAVGGKAGLVLDRGKFGLFCNLHSCHKWFMQDAD